MKTFEFSPADKPEFADDNADWLKKLNGGSYQREDLQAHATVEAELKSQKMKSSLKALLSLLK